MTTTTKILLGLCITTFWSCSNSTSQLDGSIMDKNSADNYKSNLSLVDGKYQIDTSAILNNHNLQQLIEDLEKAELADKKTVAQIPSFLKSFLDSLTEGFSIANPGEDWQVGCTSLTMVDEKGNVISEEMPKRQLIYFGLGQDLALMTYYTGGFGKSEHILIFKFKGNKILDFWCGSILTDAKNKLEILNNLKTNKDKDWGLNTNIIYL